MTPVFSNNLRLCGHYMNLAYMQNLLLFVPVATLLSNMWVFLGIINVDVEVSNLAQKFLWCALPHLLFTSLFEVHKV